MNIAILSGGSGNDALVKGLEKLYGKNKDFNIKVIVNAYDNGKSTGVCRSVTDTLGVSDIRKNHSRMYKAVYGDNIDQKLYEFYEGRYNFTKGNELEEVSNLLKQWDMPEYIQYAERFFANPKAKDYEFKDFSVSNIIYSEMYKELGYEKTNKHFCDRMGIDDFVLLNSFDNVYIKALTESGHIIDDEGKTVFWNNENDKIVKTIYEVTDDSYGINPKAVELVQNADLVLISTGTFWSSIQPTIEYLDFYKYINESKAQKIWVLNNEKDGDSWGVSSLEFIKFMEESGLDLSNFKILVNSDANPLQKMTDDKHNFVEKAMGNNNGKHDPVKFAKSVMEVYHSINDNYDKIILDFDDTIWSRDTDKESVQASIENIKFINDNLADKAIIISGNSYASIKDKLVKIYGDDLKGFNVPIWADANSTLYLNDKPIDKIKELELNEETLQAVEQLIDEYKLTDKTTKIGEGQPVNIKIKPLASAERLVFAKLFEEKYPNLFSANVTGRTTLDILSKNNNKNVVLEHLNLTDKKVLFIGDELDEGNDTEIAKTCTNSIKVNNVDETNLILKLFGDENYDLRNDNLRREAVKI